MELADCRCPCNGEVEMPASGTEDAEEEVSSVHLPPPRKSSPMHILMRVCQLAVVYLSDLCLSSPGNRRRAPKCPEPASNMASAVATATKLASSVLRSTLCNWAAG